MNLSIKEIVLHLHHVWRFISYFLLLQGLLTKLVFNLLEEGNTLFKEEKWKEAVEEFTEGLNVSLYAAADNIDVPEVLRESLYVNRAAAYQSMVRQHFQAGCKDLNLDPSKYTFFNWGKAGV